jgi:hypothetical protein
MEEIKFIGVGGSTPSSTLGGSCQCGVVVNVLLALLYLLRALLHSLLALLDSLLLRYLICCTCVWERRWIRGRASVLF